MEVYTYAISPIDSSVHEVHNPSDVQEGQYLLRLMHYFSQLLLVLHHSFFEQVEGFQVLLLAEWNTELLLFLSQLGLECGELCVLLELKERPSEDVLQVDVLQPLTVKQHVVVDVETTEQVIRVPLQHRLGDVDFHLLVEH
jgi:hypothetical protein